MLHNILYDTFEKTDEVSFELHVQ